MVIYCMSSTAHEISDVADAAESSSPPDSLLTAEEVAALLQVTCSWVYAETRKRRIPHLRLGRYVRYRRSALEHWMDDVERSSTRQRLSRVR
jgi:excisionase family DNA binding protein